MSHAISYDKCVRHEGMCPVTEIIRFNSAVLLFFYLLTSQKHKWLLQSGYTVYTSVHYITVFVE